MTCRGDRSVINNCSCPLGFYDDGISENCIKCSIECLACNNLGCTECAGNRVGPTNYICNCPINEFSVSRIEVGSGWCSSITIGVPTATMAETLDLI